MTWTKAIWAMATSASMAASGEIPASADPDFVPDPATVRRHGPAHRFPQAGWIVLHIEGEPYERGYQHGTLMAREIERYVRDLATFRSKSPADGWNDMRMLCDALFLRRYEAEHLEEMKGIADGAARAGAKFEGRPLDLIDIVAVNSDIEVEFLDGALRATPKGIEGRRFAAPEGAARPREPHCSAFAATGPATADGKVVFGHITMWNLKYVRHFNVWLDIQPAIGRRVMMQTFPGGIHSGMDYYMNDAGILVAETTIAQTRFEPNSKPLASRIRSALQKSESIDDVIRHLRDGNNGLYTNLWLMADVKTNETATIELGTTTDRVMRSSRNEWHAGRRGFYWGCNNARALEVRKDSIPSLADRPANLTFRPSDRDCKWLELFDRWNGKLDAAFGFEAFTTPPLAAFSSLDAKFTTTDLAKAMKSWCVYGNPLGRSWEPLDDMKARYPGVRPLIGNDWTLMKPATPQPARIAAADFPGGRPPTVDMGKPAAESPIWRGTILPRQDGDVWLAAAFAEHHRIAAWERSNPRKVPGAARWSEIALERHRSRAFAAAMRQGSNAAPHEATFDWNRNEWYDAAVGKGVLMLEQLRRRAGDGAYADAMDAFGTAHAGKEVGTAEFAAFMSDKLGFAVDPAALHREAVGPKDWLESDGPNHWAIDSFESELDKAVIVYGSRKDSKTNLEAANRLQRWIARKWSNVYLPIVRDGELADKQAAENHLLLVGRPATNAAYEKVGGKLPVAFGPASMQINGQWFAHEETAVICAGANALHRRFSVVAFAGLSAEATWHVVEKYPGRNEEGGPILLAPVDGAPRIVIPSKESEPRRAAADKGTSTRPG